MSENLEKVCSFCEFGNHLIAERRVPTQQETNEIVLPAMQAINDLRDELRNIFQNYRRIEYRFWRYLQQHNFHQRPWLAILPPGQTVGNGVTVGIIFEREGRGFVCGCMHPINNNMGLNAVPVGQNFNIDIGNYDTVFHNPRPFYIDNYDCDDIIDHLKISLDIAINHDNDGQRFLTYKDRADDILDCVRKAIKKVAKNADEEYLINRWIYARLQQDERGESKAVKKQLYEDKPLCFFCNKKFESMKGIHIHKKDGSKGYSKDNCVLCHKECHEKEHKRLNEKENDE